MQAWREAARSRPEWMRSTAKPRALQLGHLVFHQRDQRADDQRGAAARDARQLVAQRFAGAGGHDQQDVAALDHGVADGLLVGAEIGKPERVAQQFQRCRDRSPRQWSAVAAGRLARYGAFTAGALLPPGASPTLPTTSRDVLLDALQERRQLRRLALDAMQIRFPLARHDRALHFGVHHLDQPDAFVGGLQALAAAHHVLALEQHFDDGGARGRRAQAGLFHGVGEFFFVERLAGRLHGGEQRAFGEALGRPRLLLQDLDVHHVHPLTVLEPGRQDLLLFLFRRFAGGRQVQHLPADLLHHAAASCDSGPPARRCGWP